MLSVGCARRSNCAVECPEGDVRVVGNGRHNMRALQDKAPLGSGESTRAASNRVSLGDGYVAKRCCTEVGRCDKCRIDAVPIGRHPMSRPGTASLRG